MSINPSTLTEHQISLDEKQVEQALVKSHETEFCDTLEDLKALISVPKRVFVSGYYSAQGDDFGGCYHELLPDDGTTYVETGGVIVKNISGRFYKLKYKELQGSFFGLDDEIYGCFKTLYNNNLNNNLAIPNFFDAGADDDDGYSSAESEGTSGTKYYFSTSGDDANDGLTIDTPWKSFYRFQAKMPTFAPGDVVMFKRGDVWSSENESIVSYANLLAGTTLQPIILTCYGLGNLPKFSGKATKNLTWIDNLDGTFKTVPDIYPNVKIRNMDADGERQPGASSLIELQQNSIWNFFHDETAGEIFINFDPSTKKIEWQDAVTILTFQGDSKNFKIRYLEAEWARDRCCGVYKLSENVEISNCTLGNASNYGINGCGINFKAFHNIIDSKQPFYKHVDFGEGTYPSGGFEGIRCWGDSTTSGVEIYSNTIRNFGHANLTVNGGTTDLSGYFPAPKVFQNILDGRNLKYGGKFSVQYRVDSIYFYKNINVGGDRCQINGTNGVYKHNIFYNKFNSKYHLYNENGGLTLNVQDPTIANVFEENLFFNTSASAVLLGPSNNAEISNTIFRKNIFAYTCNDKVAYDNSATGIQFYIKEDTSNSYAFDVVDTIIQENLFISDSVDDKQIGICGEQETLNTDKTYTVEEANIASVIQTHIFSGNMQIAI